MLAKLAILAQSKVALAALGVVLVGGSGTVVAVAATTGHLGPIQTPMFHQGTPGADKGDNGQGDESGDHPNTVSIEGKLTSLKTCPANVTQLVVTRASESDEHDVKDTGESGTPTAQGTPRATHAPEATEAPEPTHAPAAATPAGSATLTVNVDSKTKVNGEQAKTLADLCGGIGHGVEVEATKGSDGSLTAWKVTLQDQESDSTEKSDGAQRTPGTGGDGSSQGSSVSGTVGAIDTGAQSFGLTTSAGKTIKVVVDAKTSYGNGLQGLSSLHSGEHISVQGTFQSNGAILATHVAMQD
ncbi:MAG TPA: DUF5666 domain-containing protein [Ktedonobacterales bacterium]